LVSNFNNVLRRGSSSSSTSTTKINTNMKAVYSREEDFLVRYRGEGTSYYVFPSHSITNHRLRRYPLSCSKIIMRLKWHDNLLLPLNSRRLNQEVTKKPGSFSNFSGLIAQSELLNPSSYLTQIQNTATPLRCLTRTNLYP